jgi:pSer/pThr/pTyr-binding forkhead associated (FHA) protein
VDLDEIVQVASTLDASSFCLRFTEPVLLLFENGRSVPSQVFVLAKGRNGLRGVTVGRDPENDVCLPFQTVSKVHASFERSKGTWVVTDLGSTNGTFLNGDRIAPGNPVAVLDGMRIAFGGPEVQVRFYLPEGFYGFLMLHAAGGAE